MQKSDLSRLIWDFYKYPSNPHIFVHEPKMEDLVVEAQNIFPNRPAERKRSRSTLLFINHSKFREKIKTGRERKQLQKQTLQIFLSPQKVLD